MATVRIELVEAAWKIEKLKQRAHQLATSVHPADATADEVREAALIRNALSALAATPVTAAKGWA